MGCDGNDHAVLVVAVPSHYCFTLERRPLRAVPAHEGVDRPALGGLGSTTAIVYDWLTDASDLVYDGGEWSLPASEWSGGLNTDSVTNTQPGPSASQPTIGIETKDGSWLNRVHGQGREGVGGGETGVLIRCTWGTNARPLRRRRAHRSAAHVDRLRRRRGSQIVQVSPRRRTNQSVTLASTSTWTAPDDGVLDLVLNSFNVRLHPPSTPRPPRCLSCRQRSRPPPRRRKHLVIAATTTTTPRICSTMRTVRWRRGHVRRQLLP